MIKVEIDWGSRVDRIKDLTGERFGKLIVVKIFGRSKSGLYTWECICDCGKRIVVQGGNLKSGHTQSCGCITINNLTKHGKLKYKGKKPKEYSIWSLMKARCYRINYEAYKYYGARGIKVCERWKNSFGNFLEDMGNCPNGNYSIERIDNDGDYEPGNCKWATSKEQSRNKRNNVYIEFNGDKMILKDWSIKTGISCKALHTRIYRCGWSIEKTLTTPVKIYKRMKNDKN